MAPARAKQRIAFDLDGTLVDARVRQVGVAKLALATVADLDLAAARFWRAKRAGATTLEALVRLGHDHGLASRVAEAWRDQIESDEWLDQDRALPGVAATLERLRLEHSTIIVITARRRRAGASRSLRAAGLEWLVDELLVVDPAASVEGKAHWLGRRRPKAFIGDTEGDGKAARIAATAFVAVATGQRNGQYLRACGYEVKRTLADAAAAVLG